MRHARVVLGPLLCIGLGVTTSACGADEPQAGPGPTSSPTSGPSSSPTWEVSASSESTATTAPAPAGSPGTARVRSWSTSSPTSRAAPISIA